MSELCPVCNAKYKEKVTVCGVCGFTDALGINRAWPSDEDGKYWLDAVVKPYRLQWEFRKRQNELIACLSESSKREDELLRELELAQGEIAALRQERIQLKAALRRTGEAPRAISAAPADFGSAIGESADKESANAKEVEADGIGDNVAGLLIHIKTWQLLVDTFGEWPSIEFRKETWSKNEMFRFIRNQDGTYKIASEISGKVLDVDGARSENGTRACLWDDSGGDNQRLYIEELSWKGLGRAKAVIFLPVCAPNSALDYSDDAIHIWERHGGWQQQFAIYPVSVEEHCGSDSE